MASKNGKIDIQLRAEELGLNIEQLASGLEAEFNQAIQDTANAAYASIISDAQSKLNRTRQDYISNVQMDQIGENSFLISLSGDWANKIEGGFPAFDMKPGMLNSQKTVEVGSRAGQPWVQKGKEGQKFAHVPLEQRPDAKTGGASDLGQMLKKLEAYNKGGRKQKLTSTFNDPSGNPLQGKVATVRNTGFKDLDGITKFQKIYKNEDTGKSTVQSVYLTWRTVSENGSGWQHPGYEGLHAFDAAEQWVSKEIDNILNAFLG